MEPDPFDTISDAQLAVLQVLWDQGPSTIGQLADAVYPGGTDTHYATVQKLLERLEKHGHVCRDRSARAHLFRAVTGREALVGHRLRVMAEKLCGGMMAPLLSQLVKAETLTAAERRELRQLIDELDGKKLPGDKRR